MKTVLLDRARVSLGREPLVPGRALDCEVGSRSARFARVTWLARRWYALAPLESADGKDPVRGRLKRGVCWANMPETSERTEMVSQVVRPLPDVGSSPAKEGWRARLAVEIGRRYGRSRIVRRSHEGPLLIQKPFYPRGHDSCQIIIVHPPGGIVGGDRLQVDVEVGEAAHALVTTPGAARFYRTAGPEASQQTNLRLAEGACLEWTPQETLLYDASRSRISTQVQMETGARFLGWDIYGLGRPAAGSAFEQGRCQQSFSLYRAGRPVWIERNDYWGGGESLTARWGLAGYTAVGTLLCTGCDAESLVRVRSGLESQDRQKVWLSATLRDDLMVVRGLAQQTRVLLDCFAGLRGCLLSAASPAARIWAT